MYNNSYFGTTPVANSGCKCNDRNVPPPVQVFDERPCFEPRHEFHRENSAVQAQLNDGAGITIAVGAPVKFNAILEKIGKCVIYTPGNGIAELLEKGDYSISWQIDTLSAGTSTTGVSFTLTTNGALYAEGVSPVVLGEVSGTAVVNVEEKPVLIQLINTSTDPVILASTNIQGNIVIVKN